MISKEQTKSQNIGFVFREKETEIRELTYYFARLLLNSCSNLFLKCLKLDFEVKKY